MERIDKQKLRKKANERPAQKEGKSWSSDWKEIAGWEVQKFLQDLNFSRTGQESYWENSMQIKKWNEVIAKKVTGDKDLLDTKQKKLGF